MNILCVAEKPSIAKSVANILSGGDYRTVNNDIKSLMITRTDWNVFVCSHLQPTSMSRTMNSLRHTKEGPVI